MRLFKAIELAYKPFVQWQETDESGSLVVREEDIPSYIYGVCPWYVSEGELKLRDTSEMDAFRAEWEIKQVLRSQAIKVDQIKDENFTYDGHEFPMDEASRLYYSTISYLAGKDYTILLANGKFYKLLVANIAAFTTSFHEKLQLITQHTR